MKQSLSKSSFNITILNPLDFTAIELIHIITNYICNMTKVNDVVSNITQSSNMCFLISSHKVVVLPKLGTLVASTR